MPRARCTVAQSCVEWNCLVDSTSENQLIGRCSRIPPAELDAGGAIGAGDRLRKRLRPVYLPRLIEEPEHPTKVGFRERGHISALNGQA